MIIVSRLVQVLFYCRASFGIPSDGIPSNGIPSDGIPSDGIPSDGRGNYGNSWCYLFLDDSAWGEEIALM